MHRSRLTSVLVDVPEELYADETRFWSEALGVDPTVDDEEPEYADFGQVVRGVGFMVQSVGAPARVHFDIETDDVEAEVERLEGYGATRVQKVNTWWVMEDPAGVLFCVVRVQNREAFERDAKTWRP